MHSISDDHEGAAWFEVRLGEDRYFGTSKLYERSSGPDDRISGRVRFQSIGAPALEMAAKTRQFNSEPRYFEMFGQSSLDELAVASPKPLPVNGMSIHRRGLNQ